MHSIVSCKIIDACPYNTSDHLPVKTCLVLSIPDSALSDSTNVDKHDTMKVFPKVNWSDPEQLEAYTKHIKHTTSALSLVHLSDVKCKTDVTHVVNDLCSVLSDVMHSSASAVLKSCSRPSTYQGKQIRKHWWNTNCSAAKSRVKFWYGIWVSYNRPRQGHVFSCYKIAKKSFRRLCKEAMD